VRTSAALAGAVYGAVGRVLAPIGRAAIDLLLPAHCATCDTLVAPPGLFCARCFAETNFVSTPCCARCGVPFGHAGHGGQAALCPVCREHPPAFARARAALRYDPHAHRLILPLKHADRIELAQVLARLMARAGTELLAQADVLVPVPLHRRRLFARRYNQAALLARAVGRIADRPVVLDALRRLRPTAPLGDHDAIARAAAVSGAIAPRAARMSRLRGARVLLVDDVMTSGATANECARVLLGAGVASVEVLVAARVPDPRLD